MISKFLIIHTFREHFKDFKDFLTNITYLLHFDGILIFLLLTVTYFPFQINYIFRVSLKNSENFFNTIFSAIIKYAYFLYDQMPKLLPLNISKEYAHLFLLLKKFLDYFHIYLFFNNRFHISAKIYSILSDFIY